MPESDVVSVGNVLTKLSMVSPHRFATRKASSGFAGFAPAANPAADSTASWIVFPNCSAACACACSPASRVVRSAGVSGTAGCAVPSGLRARFVEGPQKLFAQLSCSLLQLRTCLHRSGDPAGGRIAAAGDVSLRHCSYLTTAMDDRANHLVADGAPVGEISCAHHRNTQSIGPTLHVHRADVLKSHTPMSR